MPVSQVTADLIAADLRRDIQRGVFPPGAPLRQEDIAHRFAVSRIPVREALRALERDGLVEVLPNRGAYVVELTSAQIEEITHLRVLLEVDLITRAIARVSEEHLRSIHVAAAAADEASVTPEWSTADDRFHRALYQPASRPRQLEMTMSLRRSLERYWAIYGELPAKRRVWLRDHAQLVRACVTRDATLARRTLTDHITRAGRFLLAMHERTVNPSRPTAATLVPAPKKATRPRAS